MLDSERWGTLRWTLLGALGVSFTACGGAASSDGTSNGGGSGVGGGNSGGNSSGGASGGSGALPGTGASDGSGGEQGSLPTCTNPTERDGFVTCEEGYRHRSGVETCTDSTPRPADIIDPALCPNPETDVCCVADDDCSEARQYCSVSSGFSATASFCTQGCLKDSDCGANQICQCGDPMGSCVAASCTSDADCEGEARCSSWSKDDGCGPVTQYTCQSDQDECGGVADCAAGQQCVLEEGVRRCQDAELTCVIGRPFLVEQSARRAGITERRDWCATDLDLASIGVSGLSDAVRSRLAEHYARAGQMEHASIAAFARFSLQLLSLGAPAALVEATNQAMVDETRHARLCFALAGHYARRPLGPEELDIEAAWTLPNLAEVVRLVVREGCIGETVAALVASESAEVAALPVIAETLTIIAQDEARHAELAWRFVRWAVQQSPLAREAAAETFQVERARVQRMRLAPLQSSSEPERPLMTAHGALSLSEMERIHCAAFSSIVEPCAAAALAMAERERVDDSASFSGDGSESRAL